MEEQELNIHLKDGGQDCLEDSTSVSLAMTIYHKLSYTQNGLQVTVWDENVRESMTVEKAAFVDGAAQVPLRNEYKGNSAIVQVLRSI